ncbi:MAG: GNAT family N-acetyltransferase [Gemmatimonadota bacterium]
MPTDESVWPTLPEVIDAPRLTLRPWRLDDVDDVFTYAQDGEWSRFLRLLPSPYTRSDAEVFLARQLDLDRTTHPSWAITLEETAIGGLNLRLFPRHRLGELGYSVARAHWGQGFCTEAAGAVVDVGFRTIPELNRIRAFADVDNTASQRVMQKLGMTKEGVLRHNRVEGGVFLDEAWWGILRPEWQDAASAPPSPTT